MTDLESCSADDSSLPSSVLRRHYSTIGIDDVFLDPPPWNTLPQSYLNSVELSERPSWEIVGTIKSCPEDFVVKEIAGRTRTPQLPKDFSIVADLPTVAPSSENDASCDTVVRPNEQVVTADSETAERFDEQQGMLRTKSAASHELEDGTDSYETSRGVPVEALSPIDTVRKVLEHAFDPKAAERLLEQIRLLQEKAIIAVKQYPDSAVGNDMMVWIPPIPSDSSCLDSTVPSRGGDRGALHRALKLAFSLLKSETVMHESKSQPPQAITGNQDEMPSSDRVAKDPWICVSIDDTFFGLIPSLCRPDIDISQLNLFRNHGCILSGKGQPQRHRDKKRKREKSNRPSADVTVDDGSQVVLRLRPDLAREDRRPVHHLISSACRDFETSTISDYPIYKEKGKQGPFQLDQSTAAIVVRWSKRAERIAQKKSGGLPLTSDPRSSKNVLCVLKKRQKEHLTAIQRLTSAIGCRQSDIALAGIKDMHAVTYQFCTIRNTSPQRVQRANKHLVPIGIELGRIQEVDWTLNQGDLEGNRFEITVRDVKRIQVSMKQGIPSEVFVPCDGTHVHAMVERIRNRGFVNFYGEQRLGTPGHMSEVGVRAFDIGRALLQQDYTRAIDLLMTGRLLCRGSDDVESPEIRNARQVWKESGGDANKTLKAIPRGDAMARERIVLQGLKRYGSTEPLAALKCLHFAVRTFWINAYQSFVWNAMASERLKRFGTSVVKGDLYRVEGKGEASDVRVVENDCASINFSQIVLPLPGYSIRYPDNEMGVLYRKFLEKENTKFDRDVPPEATARGSYRPLIAFAQNLEVSFDGKSDSNGVAEEATPGAVTDFKLKFDLPSGSYATMMLREMMLTTVARS